MFNKFFLQGVTFGVVVYLVPYQDEHAGLQSHHLLEERISLKTRRESFYHITNGSEVPVNLGHGLNDVVSIDNKLLRDLQILHVFAS